MQTVNELILIEEKKALQARTKEINALLPKKQVTKKQVNRKGVNKAQKCEMLNLADTFKHVKKNLLNLSNRCSQQNISDNKAKIVSVLFGLSSDKLTAKLDKTVIEQNVYRLEKVMTNIKLLAFFLPDKSRQASELNKKAFSSTEILDLICKVLILNDKTYNMKLEAFKKQS